MKITEEKMSKQLKEMVYEGFAEHARSSVGGDGNMEDITLTAREGDLLLGVVHGKTFWGALHLKYLYVNQDCRGKGIGRQLMERLFDVGVDKGCRFAFVETMSFQAVDFYKKLGFVEEFSRSGFDMESSFHYLKRGL